VAYSGLACVWSVCFTAGSGKEKWGGPMGSASCSFHSAVVGGRWSLNGGGWHASVVCWPGVLAEGVAAGCCWRQVATVAAVFLAGGSASFSSFICLLFVHSL
jgi:hypothetical protein